MFTSRVCRNLSISASSRGTEFSRSSPAFCFDESDVKVIRKHHVYHEDKGQGKQEKCDDQLRRDDSLWKTHVEDNI